MKPNQPTESPSACVTCSGLRIVGPPLTLCSTCNGSGTAAPGTVAEGRQELWRELVRWKTYAFLTQAQAARLAEVAEVLVVDNFRYPGDGRVVAVTGVRAYLDAGLPVAACEFYDKHNGLMSDSDRLTLRIELRRMERGALVLEGLRG